MGFKGKNFFIKNKYMMAIITGVVIALIVAYIVARIYALRKYNKLTPEKKYIIVSSCVKSENEDVFIERFYVKTKNISHFYVEWTDYAKIGNESFYCGSFLDKYKAVEHVKKLIEQEYIVKKFKSQVINENDIIFSRGIKIDYELDSSEKDSKHGTIPPPPPHKQK